MLGLGLGCGVVGLEGTDSILVRLGLGCLVVVLEGTASILVNLSSILLEIFPLNFLRLGTESVAVWLSFVGGSGWLVIICGIGLVIFKTLLAGGSS